MNATELSELIQRRYQTLMHLLELSQQQIEAINENRMTDLMRVLSDKQPAIGELTEISRALSPALDDDPHRRQWPAESDRRQCRDLQKQCEQMHLELLAIEAECESKLTTKRASAQEELHRFDAGRVAASRYAQSQSSPPAGGSLDLSSD